MADEYYLNEEDLINDYINEQDDMPEPPDDYDMEPPGEEGGKVGGNTNNDVVGGGVGGDIADSNNNFGTQQSSVIPQSISTSSPTKSTSSRVTNSPYADDIYGFERYTGLSSWRSTTTSNNKGGATTMEATGWKKKKIDEGSDDAAAKTNDNDDDDNFSIDSDDLDGGRKRNLSTKNNNSSSGGGSYGLGGKGGEAQLVRFRDREALHVLGQSWGVGENNMNMNRFAYTNQNLPKLGEDSMVITLKDGTRTFVKRSVKKFGGGGDGGEEKEANNNGEGCLLGVPISELVRRADILQKRAIQRKIEREARYGSSNHKSTESKEGDETMEEDDANNHNEEGDRKRKGEEKEAASTTPPRKTPKKVSFKEETQAIQKKRDQYKQMQHQQRLWVDKHAPTSISHLLSDERTNREVLRALRGWDPYVFKKDAPTRPVPAWQMKNSGNNEDWKSKDSNKFGFGGKKKTQLKKEDDTEQGAEHQQRTDVRPDETNRVILLSGPPGVGKTTLAHIVCKHAGYRPIEVNASDERSKNALTERVMRAMESTTLDLGNLGGENNDDSMNESSNHGKKNSGKKKKGGKPNCIILDEIDGADAKASISALVDIIRADIPPIGGGSAKGKKSGKAFTTYLRRPIILICNHKYAPALRPILPYARQFDVQPPNPERLTGRLRAVLAAEHMSVVAGGMLLHRLVASTGGDVRSCVYALQFASARARELAVKKRERDGLQTGDGDTNIMVDISSTLMSALGDNGNGMKDMQSDVTSTVATVFRKGKARAANQNKRQKTAKGSSMSASITPKGVDIVLKAVDHFGDNSKTLDCLFMNVNRVSYIDPTLDRCCSAFEWLSGADTYRSHKSQVAMNNSAEHHAMQKFYIPSAAAAIHLLCCVETRPDLTFSTRPLSDCHYQNQANVSLVQRFVEGLTPRARRGVGGGTDTIVSDVIPYGLWLLSAGDGKHALSRQVSSLEMLSAEEKLAFSAHVDTLRALGLTYVKDQSASFDYSNAATTDNVRLEPEIDKLVKYEEMEHSGRQSIPPLLKELLAHGASVAAMRERERESQIAQQEAAAAMLGEKEKQKPPHVETATAKAPEKKLPSITPKKQPVKAGSNSSAAKNFLGFRAAKAKQAKTAARAARAGHTNTKKVKLSNSGSGVEISKVVRFKYQKGFTQAVRAPCQLEDLL